MARSKQKPRTPLVEAVLGFALGAVGGCTLGATEDPVDTVIQAMTSAGPMKPVMDEVRTVGALGLGTLLGSTALTTAMSSAVAGVILAAAMASVFISARGCGAFPVEPVGVMVTAGLAGALGSTLSGATLGFLVERIVGLSGMVGLLWALSIFTAFKPVLHFCFKLVWRQREVCCGPDVAREREQREQEARDVQQKQADAAQMEQTILTLEKGGVPDRAERRTAWEARRRQQEELERRKIEREEEEMEQRTIQDWINSVVVKYVDVLAFSGIPMTTIAIVTSGFGVYGYGGHQAVFVVLLSMVMVMAYVLIKSSDFKFWMLAGCMGVLATFVIAVLTLHAGQVVVTESMKMRAAGRGQSREDISNNMNHRSALEALSAGFFVAKLCQLGLGAAVGGPLVRRGAGEGSVVVGAAGMAGALLLAVTMAGPLLGQGGTAGALLGVVGATGVSVGAAAAIAEGSSTWAGTLGTIVGLVVGALGMGKWHFVNIGLQVPVAYVFAMTNPF